MPGPALLTVTVKPICEPALTEAASAVLPSETFGHCTVVVADAGCGAVPLPNDAVAVLTYALHEAPVVPLMTTINEPLVIGSYNVLDLYASFSNEKWTLRTYVKNATDEQAYSTMNNVTGEVTGITHFTAASPIQPRMFGIEVDYRF